MQYTVQPNNFCLFIILLYLSAVFQSLSVALSSHRTFSFFTLISVQTIHAVAYWADIQKGGDLRDDLLMIVRRTFVQMPAQHKGSLSKSCSIVSQIKRGKFTHANKSRLGSRCAIVLLSSQLNLAPSPYQPIYRKS